MDQFDTVPASTEVDCSMYEDCKKRNSLANSVSYTSMLTSKLRSKLLRSKFAEPMRARFRSMVSVFEWSNPPWNSWI